jgi:outer membrane protein TolC
LALIAVALAAAPAPVAAQAPVRRLSLEAAVALAQPGNEAVGIAEAGVLRANGELKRSYAEFFPQLSTALSYTYQIKSQYSAIRGDSSVTGPTQCNPFFPDPTLPTGERLDSVEQAVHCLSLLSPFAAFGTLPFGQKHQYNFGLSGSQLLFSGSMIKGKTRAAKAGRRLAEIGVTSAEAQLVLRVTEAYYDAVLSDRLLKIGQATLDQADTTLIHTKAARAAGTQPEFDVIGAQVARDNQRPIVIQRLSDRQIAYLRLRQLLNLPLDEPLELTTLLGDTIPGLQAKVDSVLSQISVDQRAPVRQAQEAVTVQEVLRGLASGEQFPTVTLTSKYSKLAYPQTLVPDTKAFLTDWYVAVKLELPLYTGGRIKGDKMVAQANLDEARLQLAQTRKLTAVDNQSTVAVLEAAAASWEASQGTVEQATKAYGIAEIRFQEGISTQTELLSSRLQLQQAEANRAVAARDLMVALVRTRLLPDLPLGGVEAGQTGGAQVTLPTSAPATQPVAATTATGTAGPFTP